MKSIYIMWIGLINTRCYNSAKFLNNFTTKKEAKLGNIKESIANIDSKFGSEFKKLNELAKVT